MKFLLFFILFASPSFAEAKEDLSPYSAYRVSNTDIKITPISKSECTAFLRVAFSPETEIKKGLLSLSEVVDSAKKQKIIHCINEPWMDAPAQPATLPPFNPDANKPVESVLGKSNFPYGVRRLLARYNGYLNSGGDPADLSAFCANYESLQLRDKNYAKTWGNIRAIDHDNFWKFAEKYGLTEGELSAIDVYSGGDASWINQALWSGKAADAKLTAFREMMNAALARLPDNPGRFTRSTTVPAEELGKYKEGQLIEWPGYTSTSKGEAWKRFGGKHHFTIYGAHGKEIGELARIPQEDEVLFRAGTKFKILARKESGDIIEFVLVETDDEGKQLVDVPGYPRH